MINIGPLTPYLDKELLYNHSLSIDGAKIEGLQVDGVAFKLQHPKVTQELLKEVVDDFKALKLWPSA